MKQAKCKHKKEVIFTMATMGILVAGLIIMSSVGIFLPQIICSFILTKQVDAIQILNAMIYPVIVPLLILVILIISLIVLVGYCLRHSGGYWLAGAIISLMLGGLAIFIGFMSVVEEVSLHEILEAVEDKQQIQSGELTETKVYINGGTHVNIEVLIGLTDDVGYQVTEISGLPTDMKYDTVTYYYFPYTVHLEPYENIEYADHADYKESKNATIFSIWHTKNQRIIMGIEVVRQ